MLYFAHHLPPNPILRFIRLSVLMLLLCGALPVMAGTGYLSLTSETPDAEVQWRVISSDAHGLRLECRLSALHLEDVLAGNETWQKLTIEGGGLLGPEGSPGLPAIGHLVAVPSDVLVQARVMDFDIQEFRDLRLLPIQPGSASEFSLDSSDYSRAGWRHAQPAENGGVLALSMSERSGPEPTVLLGQPAMMAGQAVLPLTFSPVIYDPVTRRAMVTSRVEIEITFDHGKVGTGYLSPSSHRAEPGAAFTSLMQDQVAGYVADRDELAAAGELGTWAMVCRNDDVRARCEPLIAWRARQGYHVEVIVTAGTPTSIKSQLQGIYDDPNLPPLAFILLAGDTEASVGVSTWNETLSGYDGEGDHYYTTLDGDDILADCHVGRLSFASLDMADTIISKIVNYEQTPPMDDIRWYRKACVVGDPADSGITTIYVNQWLKGQFFANGYASVDTVWDGHFLSQVNSSINAGISAFGYRGFWNMSGITPGHINALANGDRLPVAILPTCETGTFEGGFTCHTEAFLRAPNGGAIAAVGTATGGTHTRYNNCFYHGIWDGLLNANDHRIGAAHTLGKIELYNNYYLAEPETAEIWAVWNNIMGDAATPIWQDVPRILTVDHLAQVSVGSGAVEIRVESDSVPVEGALVCLHRVQELQVTGRTNSAGVALLSVPPLTAGAVQVTVSGQGLHPYLGGLNVGTVDLFCGLSAQQIDDDGDGLLNPGELVELSLAVTNHGTGTAFGVSGQLSGGSPWSIIESDEVDFGEVASGATIWSDSPAVVRIDPATPDGTAMAWPLWVTAAGESWPSVVHAVVHAAALSITDLDWSAGATFEPGQSGQLTMELVNDGSIDAIATSCLLTSGSPYVQVIDDSATFGTIAVGASQDNELDPFQLAINSECHPGHLAVLQLDINYSNGMQTVVEFTVTVGSAETDDPTGPDAYGYFAFDNTDTESWYVPTYDWVALDPEHAGPGTSLGLQDFGWEQDDTKTVDLPFTFQYYGVDFNQVSICSNGWLAMGETPLVHYRNYSIPSKGSCGSLIAPFWDNLHQVGNHQVYTWYDEVGHRYIVQWYNLLNDYSGSVQNFEVILLDPAWHQTLTGDGVIIFQYETVNNTDARDGYATVGIQNHDRTDGLLYSYWNQYSAGAALLTTGRAIRFQPVGEIVLPEATISPASFDLTLEPGGQVEQTLQIANAGPEGSILSYQIERVDPATIPDGRPASPDKSIQGSTMTMSTGNYEPGTTLDVEVSVHAVAPNGFLTVVTLLMPPGVTLNSGGDLAIDGNSVLFWGEQVGPGCLTTWDGHSGEWIQYIPDGASVTATLNLSFAEDLVGELEFEYMLEDEGYWTPADQVFGAIILGNDLPSVRVEYPEAGTVAVIGEELPIQYSMVNAGDRVDIDLQRQPGGAWESLVQEADAAAGSWTWQVAGDPGPYAVIRVTDSLDPAITGESDTFAVGRNLDWLQLTPLSGAVNAGQSVDITLTLDAAGLALGDYEAVLVITTNSGQSFNVPIDLTVDDTSGAGAKVPRTVSLLGNYPNPFNPSTTLSFALPSDMPVTLDIYSARGMRVRRVLAEPRTAGVHHVVWDGTDSHGRTVASGVYFYRLVTPEATLTDKVLLAK